MHKTFDHKTIRDLAPAGATVTILDEPPYVMGVHFTMPSGRVFSIQWGVGNYCENRMTNHRLIQHRRECITAEFATWIDDIDTMEEPEGWMTPADVVARMDEILAADS